MTLGRGHAGTGGTDRHRCGNPEHATHSIASSIRFDKAAAAHSSISGLTCSSRFRRNRTFRTHCQSLLRTAVPRIGILNAAAGGMRKVSGTWQHTYRNAPTLRQGRSVFSSSRRRERRSRLRAPRRLVRPFGQERRSVLPPVSRSTTSSRRLASAEHARLADHAAQDERAAHSHPALPAKRWQRFTR